MDEKTLSELAFYRIRASVASFSISTEAKKHFDNVLPLTDEKKIESLKSLSQEWTIYLTGCHDPAILFWPEIQHPLQFLAVEGSVLAQDELFSLLQLCQAVNHVVKTITKATETLSIENLKALCATLPTSEMTFCAFEIEKILDHNGAIKDLPPLREIRNRIAFLKTEIDSILHKYTSDSSLADVLESNVPAYRAERQVLAVKTTRRSKIRGIVHEMSQSGQTLYIEPEEIVKRNNDLVQEEFHLQQEIRKILSEITNKLRPYQLFFRNSIDVMITLDKTQAAALWGKKYSAVFAQLCSANVPPLLLQARHPLLEDRAVPIDIQFITGRRVLIITGPNTGGKTVTIKTFALFAMLNQAGFPVPAAEGTRLPVFSNIFADIGDEQSIDQSLSTFSAHMKNIGQAVKEADENSLILLDELGSGTDPQEGGAIAMAVLDNLIETKAFVLVTTHHGILKNYGYTNPSCINASVDFDAKTLSPTYRLVMGVPGESHALDIASKSGLSPELIEKAKLYLTHEQADVSTLIKGLTAKHAELDELQKIERENEIRISERQARITQKELDLRQRENELREQQHINSSIFLREARSKLENLVRTIREGEINREKTLAVKQFITDLETANTLEKDNLEQETMQLALEKESASSTIRTSNGILINTNKSKHPISHKNKTDRHKISNQEAFARATAPDTLVTSINHTSQQKSYSLQPGASVLIGSAKRPGTLIRLERKGLWSVQVGSIRMNIKEKEIELIRENKHITPSITIELAGKNIEGNFTSDKNKIIQEKPVYELRLLGLRSEEAIKILQRQLDLCTIQNFKSFSIIHGKGTGILQQAVQDYLSHYQGIEKFYFAQPEDGGTGKTYVTLI